MVALRRKKKRIVKRKKFPMPMAAVICICVLLLGIFVFLEFQYVSNPELVIISPSNKIYHTKNVFLNVHSSSTSEILSSIDNGPNTTECTNCTGFVDYYMTFADGVHIIQVYAKDLQNRTSKTSIIFTVQT